MNDDARTENETLLQLFKSQGVEARSDGAWIRLPRDMAARAVAWPRETGQPGITMLQLDIVLELWAGRWIVESCTGYGASRTEALDNAFTSFASSALNPMLVAFFHTDHPAVRDACVIDGVTRALTIGEVVVRGTLPDEESLDMGWFRTFKSKLKEASIPGGTHWVRIYYAQQKGELLAKEVLLDNEPWDWMQGALSDVAWPKAPEFLSLRVFLVLQGGVDVSRAVARMIEMPGRPDAEISQWLAKDGADPTEALALLAYLPLAFGRKALQELPIKFAQTATVQRGEEDEGTEIRLEDDAIFAQADQLARRALEQGTMTQDQFLAVASRSAEVHAVNNAMTQGAEAKDLVVSSPQIRLY